MTVRSNPQRLFYRDQYAAAVDSPTQVRDLSGTLPTKGVLILGGPAPQWADVSALAPGTLVPVTGTCLSHMVITNLAAADATTNLSVADGMNTAVAGTGAGVGVVLPRAPRYTAGHEAQKVVYNAAVTGVDYTITYEETAVPGFVDGGHPGNGVVTVNLGSIDPGAYDANTAPLHFRINAGRKWILTAAHVRSIVPIAPTGTATIALARTDATVTLAAFDLKTLVSGTSTAVTLKTAEASRTIDADQYLDIVIALGSYDGTAGDIMVDIAYTLP